jgi:hypothetical protein
LFRYPADCHTSQGAKAMPLTAAIPIEKAIGVTPTDDGSHTLVKVEQAPGTEITLAIKDSQINNLIGLLALGNMQCRKIHNTPQEFREVHTTTWWELAVDQITGLKVLSLTFGPGGRLDFSLPGMMPERILETLRTLLEPSTVPTQNKPPN